MYIYIYILEVMFTTAARLFEGGAQKDVISMDKISFRIRAWSWEHQKPHSEFGGNGSCVGRVFFIGFTVWGLVRIVITP